MKFIIEKTEFFEEWFYEQTDKTQGIIRARFSRIEIDGHFGLVKPLGDGLLEMKWQSGIRVYFAYLSSQSIIVLLGGSKSGQSKDIKKAKSFLR